MGCHGVGQSLKPGALSENRFLGVYDVFVTDSDPRRLLQEREARCSQQLSSYYFLLLFYQLPSILCIVGSPLEPDMGVSGKRGP